MACQSHTTINHFNCACDGVFSLKAIEKLNKHLNKTLFPVATETIQDTNMLLKQFQPGRQFWEFQAKLNASHCHEIRQIWCNSQTLDTYIKDYITKKALVYSPLDQMLTKVASQLPVVLVGGAFSF